MTEERLRDGFRRNIGAVFTSLVVIAIIAIVASLLLRAPPAADLKAQPTNRLSNLTPTKMTDAGSLAERGDAVKELSVVIDKPEADYVVDVGGALDPENVEITIENAGDNPLINPRLSVNGRYDWHDIKAMADEAAKGAKTDEDKALAIWFWITTKSYHRFSDDFSSMNPVRGMNGYGYGICGTVSAWFKALCLAAGVQARVQELWQHTVAEAYYNGGWHMFDTDQRVYYLARDNRTIASLADLEKDPALIERVTPGGPHNDHIATAKDNYVTDDYDIEIAQPYTMAMTLKPGEKLVRWWESKPGKHGERWAARNQKIRSIAGGQLIWEPDLRRIDVRPYLFAPSHGNIATCVEDGRAPAIHIADLQDARYTRPSYFSIPVSSPYPIIGGHLTCTFVKQGRGDFTMASIGLGRADFPPGELYDFGPGTGTKVAEVDLDPHFAGKAGVYKYQVRFVLRGDAQANPPAQTGIESLRMVTDLQVAPHSLPALSPGRNTIHFRSDSDKPIKVRITHRWRESNSLRPPGTVEAAVAPADGGRADSLAPTLKWVPAAGSADYQVMISLRSDCLYPLSANLEAIAGANKTEWKVPDSFFNPTTIYYWKVRARDSHGNFGEWSPVFRFMTPGQAG